MNAKPKILKMTFPNGVIIVIVGADSYNISLILIKLTADYSVFFKGEYFDE